MASASRVWLGRSIEASHDEAGIIWPEPVAPFGVGIINLRVGEGACDTACENAYAALTAAARSPAGRYQRAAGRQIRRHGSHRPALAGDRRPQGAGRGGGELKRRATGERRSLPLGEALKRFAGEPIGRLG